MPSGSFAQPLIHSYLWAPSPRMTLSWEARSAKTRAGNTAAAAPVRPSIRITSLREYSFTSASSLWFRIPPTATVGPSPANARNCGTFSVTSMRVIGLRILDVVDLLPGRKDPGRPREARQEALQRLQRRLVLAVLVEDEAQGVEHVVESLALRGEPNRFAEDGRRLAM